MGDIDIKNVMNQLYGSSFAVTVQLIRYFFSAVTVQLIRYLLNVNVSHFKADNI